MDNENRALNTILIIEIILIFFFSYGAVPTHDVEPSSHRISKKIHQKAAHKEAAADTEAEESDSHESAGKKHAAVTHEQKDSEEIEETEDAVEHPSDKAEEHAAVQSSEHHEKEAEEHAAEPAKEPAAKAAGGGGMPDVIAMNNPGYSKHTKGVATFTHQKHVKDYAIGCGDCHHDESGTPLELSESDPVQGCIECHSETEKPKGEKLGKEESIAKYHKEALHANCIGCHKAYNIEHGDPKGKKPAPTSCGKCHPKN